jgi:hypothetical protein
VESADRQSPATAPGDVRRAFRIVTGDLQVSEEIYSANPLAGSAESLSREREMLPSRDALR